MLSVWTFSRNPVELDSWMCQSLNISQKQRKGKKKKRLSLYISPSQCVIHQAKCTLLARYCSLLTNLFQDFPDLVGSKNRSLIDLTWQKPHRTDGLWEILWAIVMQVCLCATTCSAFQQDRSIDIRDVDKGSTDRCVHTHTGIF